MGQDAESDQERNITKTPVIDDAKLETFDARRQKISNLLVDDKQEVALEDCSKPVREVLKINYGVQYNEEVSKGGKMNCTMGGQSVYDSPKRKTMRLSELQKRQEQERQSKIQKYIEAQGYPGTATAITVEDNDTPAAGHSPMSTR